MGTILISGFVSLIAIVGFVYFQIQDKKEEKRLNKKPHSEVNE